MMMISEQIAKTRFYKVLFFTDQEWNKKEQEISEEQKFGEGDLIIDTVNTKGEGVRRIANNGAHHEYWSKDDKAVIVELI